MSDRLNLATANEFHAEIARLHGEIDKLRQRLRLADAALAGCVTKPLPKEKRAEVSFTLTDAERSAIADAADRYAEITPESAETAATLRGLLERLG